MHLLPSDPHVVRMLDAGQQLRAWSEQVTESSRRALIAMRPMIDSIVRFVQQVDLVGSHVRAAQVGYTGATMTPRQLAHWHRTAGRPRRR